ncbi:recombinase family protein [Nonomuraea polychroma]|uniref:recombinase family protein n=1 Tax=Nonomuraea polychroma TaxID=46176 RepID=UPI0019D42802|nr:recombinase family protein [Nonomuraea polychroma]
MNGTRVGYARCSTDEQDVVIQTEQLLTLGVPEDRIYIDRGFSGTTRRNRAGLDQALAAVWNGPVFTVTKFDRFARNMAEANEILTDLSGRGVLFGLGGSVYDWNDPFGRLFLQTLAMVAEFEANLGHMRTREGHGPGQEERQAQGQTTQAARIRPTFHPPPIRRGRDVPGRPGHRVQRRTLHHPPHHPRARNLHVERRIIAPPQAITHRRWASLFAQDHSHRQWLFLGSSTPYTDGIVEERHVAGGEPFGEERLIRCVNRLGDEPSRGCGRICAGSRTR